MEFSSEKAKKLYDMIEWMFDDPKKSTSDITMHWNMTYWCNYNCPYCIQKGVKPNGMDTSQEKLELFASKLRKMFSGKTVKLTILGGEISFFNLNKICEILFKDNNCNGMVMLITNLSAPAEVYKNFLQQNYENINLIIRASYQWVEINSFVSKVKEINNKNLSICDIVVDDTKTMEEILRVKNIFEKNNISCAFTTGRIPMTNSTKYFNVSPEIKQFIEHSANNVSLKALKVKFRNIDKPIMRNRSFVLATNNLLGNGARFENFNCIPALQIYPNGDIYNGMCHESKKIGNLLDENSYTYKPYAIKCSGKYGCSLCAITTLYTENT